MADKNRQQRRHEKFGGGRVGERGGWPASSPNPALRGSGGADEALAGRPDQGQTAQTGPGTGGATENDDRMPEHEGTHGSNSAKG